MPRQYLYFSAHMKVQSIDYLSYDQFMKMHVIHDRYVQTKEESQPV